MDFFSFLEGVSAAMIVKLTSSIDDVIWLSAFLTPKHSSRRRTQNALTYAGVCLLQTCLAFILSTSGEMGMERLMAGGGGGDDDHEPFMSPDRFLTLLSGTALFVYAIVLGVEYYNEHFRVGAGDDEVEYATVAMDDDDGTDSENKSDYSADEEEEESGSRKWHDDDDDDDHITTMTDGQRTSSETRDTTAAAVAPLEIEDGSSDNKGTKDDDGGNEEEEEPRRSSDNKESRSLAVVSFLGSLDDLTLFVPMLVGKTFGIFELIVGAMVATLVIVFICLFLTQCQLVANILEKVPLVAIVAGFCIMLIIKGTFFMD